MEEKFFTTKQRIKLITLIVFLINFWLTFAFLVKEDWIPRLQLWASLVFGTGAIITSVLAIGISILSYRKEEKMRKQHLADLANSFIIKNNDEIDYLPLCLIANAYDPHHKYIRNIYKEFNLLNDEIKKAVLDQLNYDYQLIKTRSWIDSGIDNIRSYIKENELGNDLLYDGAKYFHRSMERYADNTFEYKIETMPIFVDHFKWSSDLFFKGGKLKKRKVSFDTYLNSYLYEKRRNSDLFIALKDEKPLSLLTAHFNLLECEESLLCAWMMEVVLSISNHIIAETRSEVKEEVPILTKSDAVIETFEDRYLECLMELYNIFLYRKKKITYTKIYKG